MNIEKIKKYILSMVNSKVMVVSLQNRNKEEKYEGVINKTYKHLFTIVLNNGKCKSFSYVDILVGNVRVYI